MTFQDQLATLNEFFFFQEFTFSKNTFQPKDMSELELADNIVFLDDLLIVYQIKERQAPNDTGPETEATWFNNKVLKKATKQIRDTLRYLKNHSPIKIENHRGHVFELSMDKIATLDKLVVYQPDKSLSTEYLKIKYHHSSTAGIIHVIPAKDYLGICRTLITPTEVHEYLSFRENLCTIQKEKVLDVHEPALVGQYLAGALKDKPDISYIDYLASLEQKISEWNMAGIVKHFPESIIKEDNPTDYYKIISEIAKLKRTELKEFKDRFILAMKNAKKNKFDIPYRMAIPRTECGFVFVPTIDELKDSMVTGLKNFTYAHKYELKLKKCVGVSFFAEKNGYILHFAL